VRSIFVSYRHADSPDVTGRITDRLVDEFGADEIFVDHYAIPLGRDFRAEIDSKLSRCEVVLAIVGPGWVGSGANAQSRLDDPEDYVRVEIETALKRGIPVIPVLVQGTAMPSGNTLPPSLREFAFRNAAQVRPDPDFHNDMDRLLGGLRDQTHLQNGESTTRAGRQPMSMALARKLSVLLIVLELLQVVVFLLTDADGARLVSVVVANAIGAALLLVARPDRNPARTTLGLTAVLAPWLLRLLADPVPAVAGTALLVSALAALYLTTSSTGRPQ
jgi:TIR domain